MSYMTNNFECIFQFFFANLQLLLSTSRFRIKENLYSEIYVMSLCCKYIFCLTFQTNTYKYIYVSSYK